MKIALKGLMRACGRTTVLATAAALALGVSAAHAGNPYPTKATPQARDLGAATDVAITVTVSLKNRDPEQLKSLLAGLYTPGDAQFHKFLSSADYHQRFDPSAESVAKVTAWLSKAGLSVRHEGGTMLEVTGSAAQLQAAFGVGLRQYEVPAHGRSAAYRFHAALGAPKIAQADVAALVDSIVGLDNFPRYAPNSQRTSAALAQHVHPQAAKNSAAGNMPGEWTVNDLAAYYNVTPLYDAGIHGEGQTIAIVTLASFTPSDAFQYWSDAGLTVDRHRIRIVDIDGGSGPISDAGGSGETTLDVEQSGGMAPAAKIIVYEAPNTDHSFTHAFAKAVNDNIAASISVSWGEFEWFETLGRTKARAGNIEYLKAFNQIFLQAAAQGQSMIAASGDAGAYEANRALPAPQFTETLSVGAPGSSPWITAAGGTTVPTTLVFSNGVTITVPTEQAWGWDYLRPLCRSLGLNDFDCGIWGVGSGGGVSSFNHIPSYQKKVDGMEVTPAGQSLVDLSTGIDYVDLPADYAGRNVPDVSLNADPETGYIIDYTDENGNYGTLDFFGGTSFTAPQLNGITALLVQNTGSRIGLLNFPLYQLARKASAWTGKNAPFNDITAGDNWFYLGAPGYDLATGVGTLNVANFAAKLAGQ